MSLFQYLRSKFVCKHDKNTSLTRALNILVRVISTIFKVVQLNQSANCDKTYVSACQLFQEDLPYNNTC